jgi:hypothetical protein
VTAADLSQLLGALTALVAALGGVAAVVASRMSRRQRQMSTELRNLRDYAALVEKWGWQVRLILGRNGIDAPPMPQLFAEDDDEGQVAEPDRPSESRPAAQPRPAERPAGDIAPATWPAAHPRGVGNLGPGPDDFRSGGRHVRQPDTGPPTAPWRSIGARPPAHHQGPTESSDTGDEPAQGRGEAGER